MSRGRSATHELAAWMANAENGLSQAKIHEFLEALGKLKKQHQKSRKGNPSLVLKYLKECRR
jgi:hypothetical protein